MTVTIVLGKATDGYLDSGDASYSTARNGPADSVTGGSVAWFGQNHGNPGYHHLQAFFGFDYTAIPATEQIVSAQIQLSVGTVQNPSVPRNAEIRGYSWSPGGLITGDFRNAANLAALPLYGQVYNLHQAGGKRISGSSDALPGAVAAASSMEFVIHTERQRAGTVPAVNEDVSIYTADADGTADDPALVITTYTKNKIAPGLGASVELSDGTWVHMVTAGSTPALMHVTKAGVSTNIGTVPVGIGDGTNFANIPAAQGLALTVDSADNLYVIGRSGNAENTLAAKAWTKNVGGYTWTAQTMRSANMTAYDGAINNVAAAWHPTAGGRIMALVGHAASTGAPSNNAYWSSDTVWVLLDSTYLRTGSGTLLKGTGTAVGTLITSSLDSDYFNLPTNETGTMLDVVAAGGGNTAWGFTVSATKAGTLGSNRQVSLGRYIINAAGTGLDSASNWSPGGWAVKDANTKLRAVRISSSAVAVVSADNDSGWGLTMSVNQYSGTTGAPTQLGFQTLGGQAITNLPAETVVAHSPAWDAVYNETENRLWIYYVDSASPNAVRRTAVDLSTMQLLLNSVAIYAAPVGAVVNAVRIPRNSAITERVMLEVAYTLTGVIYSATVIDTYNLPPTAPVLGSVVNYDATIAKAFTWTPTDPNPGDTQSAYQLQVIDADLGTTALDTGKILSAVSSHNIAGGTLVNNKSYQWRVMTWDAADAAGAWSNYGSFQTTAGGAVTIIDPATDNPPGIDTDDLYVTWSVTGTVQAAYRVILRRMSNLAVVQDSGWVTSTATTALVSGMATDVPYRIEVQVRNASLVLSGVAQRLVTPSYATPEPPVLSLTALNEQGYMLVTVNNPVPGQPEVPGAPEHTFESGSAAAWTPTGCTFVASTEQAHTGTYSGKMTVTGTPVQAYARDYTVKTPVVAGVRYTARMWVRRSTVGDVGAAIDWTDEPAGTYLSTSAVSQVVAANTWTLISVTGICPPGADGATFGPTLSGSPATGTVCYVDDISFSGASDRPDVATNLVLRRLAGTEDPWDLVGEVGVDGSIRDYCGSGMLYEYKARGVTA